MITIKTIPELKDYLNVIRGKKLRIGLIPTMGALHEGHISLIERAKTENEVTVCSIFVNPTQFNDPKDLERYPRTLATDSAMLVKAGCDVLFLPEISEMYPSGSPEDEKIDLGLLDKVMEGAQRPGHFAGVVQIVRRLFDAVEADRSYFGQKDFQQLAIIREMARQTGHKTEIVACPIVREANGLAMSSRNTFLSPEERREAGVIYKTLQQVRQLSASEPVPVLLQKARENLSSYPGMNIEYFEIVNARTLLPVKNIGDASSTVACVAVKLGRVRLIDNIHLR